MNRSPFGEETPLKNFRDIQGRWPVPDPDNDEIPSKDAQLFIEALLAPDPETRLGSTSATEVKGHSWFNTPNEYGAVDWSKAFLGKLPTMDFHLTPWNGNPVTDETLFQNIPPKDGW